MPPRYAQSGTPMPIEQAQQQSQIYQPEQGVTALPQTQPQAQGQQDPTQRNTMIFALVVAALAGVGWWAYKSMEKDRKFKLGSGPRRMEEYGGDDEDGSDDDRDSEPDTALDAYADADVDPEVREPPHERGGIKLVKG